MYVLKYIPEDFVVKEISSLGLSSNGRYSYYLLWKKNWNTLDVLKEISKRIEVPVKNIGYSGNKDKNAVTEQYISLPRKIKKISLKDVKLTYVGHGDVKLGLGDHECNEFLIVVRNLDHKVSKSIDKIVNYFDTQRFGRDNVEIGRNFLKRDFSSVCSKLGLDVECRDYIGALQCIDKRMIRFYLHSVQSLLWNEVVEEYDKIPNGNIDIPLVSFDTEFDPKIEKIYLKILRRYDIKLDDFLFREIPWLTEETVYRSVYVPVKCLKFISCKKDIYHLGKFEQTISFQLGKGSYATIVAKQLFS